jgi:hypothetical protein
MTTKTRILAASLLFALAPQLVALPAHAQADSDAVTVQARARFKEGVEFYDKGQYESARLAFIQAYALKKHPAVLVNLAQSSAKANHPLEAAKYFQQFLRESTSASPQQKQDAESGLAEVRQKLGRIEVVAPPGTEISLDDARVGNAPIGEPLDVEPGAHTLKSPSETVKVVATVGQKVQAKFGASTTAAPPIVPPPVVAPIPTPPPVAPAETPAVAQGASAAGADAGPSKRGGDLFAPPKTMVPVYGGLTVAGIGLAATIIFAVFKSDAQTKANKVAAQITDAATNPTPPTAALPTQGLCSQTGAQYTRFQGACATLRDNNDKVDTNATIANVAAVVGGVGLLTAVGWYLFAPKKEDPAPAPSVKHPTISPYAGWDGGGFVLSGSL